MGHMTVRPVIGILALALPILALALPTLAPAATYCVATADQLRNALQSAATSAGSDQIRIRSGTYGAPGLPGTQAQYELMLTGNGDLDISGGWTDAACSQQDPRAEVTILDGLGQRRIFDIGVTNTNGVSSTVWLRNTTIRRGSASGDGGCFRFQGFLGAGAALLLERVRFSECVSGARGGALMARSRTGADPCRRQPVRHQSCRL